MKPLALFGLSGVGKTTLARGLVSFAPHQFYLLPIATSRPLRPDDNPLYVESLISADFISLQDRGSFALSWQQDGNFYGYRHTCFELTEKHPVMTCSLSAIQRVKEYGAITVLVKGKEAEGLDLRGCEETTKARTLLNARNIELYLTQPWFKEHVDIKHTQSWGDPLRSIQNLYNLLFQKEFV